MQQLGTWAAWQRPAKPVTHKASKFSASEFRTSDFFNSQTPGKVLGLDLARVMLIIQKMMPTTTSCTRSTGSPAGHCGPGPKGCNVRGLLSMVRSTLHLPDCTGKMKKVGDKAGLQCVSNRIAGPKNLLLLLFFAVNFLGNCQKKCISFFQAWEEKYF